MSVSGDLALFQDRLARALLDRDGHDDDVLASLVSQPAFAVYRNTVLKGCIDALAANFPAVQRLVGEEWFRDAAAVYARRHLPQRPMLLDYGAGFAQFLADFAPAAALPYLAGVARLDRFWSEAHFARDEVPLDPAPLLRLDRPRVAKALLRPHASARWAWFPTMPIRTIWQRNRDDPAGEPAGDIDWRGEGVLVVRPHGAVESIALDEAGCVFLQACADGRRLIDAIEAADDVQPGVDLSQLASTLLSAGALAQALLPGDAERENK